MFIQTWKKYLPVILFLMKRSSKGQQTLDMNLTDFDRAARGKKIKFNFSNIIFDNGRVNHDSNQTGLVTDLIMVLQQSEPAEILMQYQQFSFSMNIHCQLMITNITPFTGHAYNG